MATNVGMMKATHMETEPKLHRTTRTEPRMVTEPKPHRTTRRTEPGTVRVRKTHQEKVPMLKVAKKIETLLTMTTTIESEKVPASELGTAMMKATILKMVAGSEPKMATRRKMREPGKAMMTTEVMKMTSCTFRTGRWAAINIGSLSLDEIK